MSVQNQQILKTVLPTKASEISQQIIYDKGYIYNFFNIVSSKLQAFPKTLFGDYNYVRKNKYTVNHKRKVLNYLQAKYLTSFSKMKEQQQKIYVQYNFKFFQKIPQDVGLLKEMILHGKTQVQAAQQGLERFNTSKQYIKAKFMNEAAYQFDRQRYCSIIWGLITGSIINTTIYKKGSFFRKGALLITFGHIFGQIGYHVNLDKYFDSVYSIFEEQAMKFNKQQQQREQKLDKTFTKTSIQD